MPEALAQSLWDLGPRAVPAAFPEEFGDSLQTDRCAKVAHVSDVVGLDLGGVTHGRGSGAGRASIPTGCRGRADERTRLSRTRRELPGSLTWRDALLMYCRQRHRRLLHCTLYPTDTTPLTIWCYAAPATAARSPRAFPNGTPNASPVPSWCRAAKAHSRPCPWIYRRHSRRPCARVAAMRCTATRPKRGPQRRAVTR